MASSKPTSDRNIKWGQFWDAATMWERWGRPCPYKSCARRPPDYFRCTGEAGNLLELCFGAPTHGHCEAMSLKASTESRTVTIED